jgi:hypothetical protein
MYLVAWDEANWPDHLPSTAEALAAGAGGRLAARQRRQYSRELACLEQARRALPADAGRRRRSPAARPPRGHDHTAHRQAAHPALTGGRRRWCPARIAPGAHASMSPPVTAQTTAPAVSSGPSEPFGEAARMPHPPALPARCGR